MAGIYIHVPFCKKACYYCNFHFSTSAKYTTEMVDSICTEIELQKNYLNQAPINSIYFGGGTPSLLSDAELLRISDTIYKHFNIAADAEITLEANPDDLSKSKIKKLKKLGINRLSIGTQSFFDEDLEWLNRAHSAKEAHQSIIDAQDAGIENITIDLIYGLPISNVKRWEQNIEQFLDLEIPHLSCYALTIEPKTVFGNWLKHGKIEEVKDEIAEEQFLWMSNTLRANEYQHYEISNLSKIGYAAIHNSNYWKGSSYLGVGPSAHSYNQKSRQWNIAHNAKYMDALSKNELIFEMEEIDNDTRYNELVMLGMRTMWGVDFTSVKQIGNSYAAHFLKNVEPYLHSKQIIHVEANYILVQEARFLSDGIAADLFI